MFSVSKESISELRKATGAGVMAVRSSLLEAEGNMERALEILRIRGATTAEAISNRPVTQGKVTAVVDNNLGVIAELNCETDFAAENQIFQSLVKQSLEFIKRTPATNDKDFLSQNAELRDYFNNAIGSIRENIRLTRFYRCVASEHGHIFAYEHGGGKIATLVELGCSDARLRSKDVFLKLGRDVALQITAMGPRYICRDDVPPSEFEKELRIELSREDIASKPDHLREKIALGRAEKNLSANILLSQAFVKDSAQSIDRVLKEFSAKMGVDVWVVGFTRYVLGESLVVTSDSLEQLILPPVDR